MALQLDIIKQLHGGSPVPYAVIDEDFSVVWANDCALSRYPQLSIPGGLGLLLSSAQLEAARKTDGAFTVPLAAVDHFAASFTPIEGGHLISIGFSDAADAAAMLPQSTNYIISAVTNQLRDPLSNIFVNASALACRSEISGDERMRELLEGINASGYRMLRFVTDFTAYLHHLLGEEERPPRFFDLCALANRLFSAAALITESIGIPMTTDIPAGPAIIFADEKSIELALLHILSNCCRFSCEGNRIAVALSLDAGNARITISDKGLGIPPDVLPSICEPFFSYDHLGEPAAGCGLGLSIARRAIAQCGGSFAVTSAPDEGAVVAVSLPLAKDKKPDTLQSPRPAADMLRDRFSLLHVILSDSCGNPRL